MKKNICVVVLGDIGRSPRINYHSISFAKLGHRVDIVGYRGATPIESLTSQPLVSFHFLTPYPNIPLPRFINYVFKTIWQLISLLLVFAVIRKADYVFVQNPPAVPSLLACYIYKVLARAKLIIDWHNYAHTIMGLTLSPNHLLVRLTKAMEVYFGKKADGNFCVTKAMREDLKNNWEIEAIALYDRPYENFQPIDLKDKHALLNRLANEYKELSGKGGIGNAFTIEAEDGNVVLHENRPGLIISSTSWTEDEDFSILLAALQEYETLTRESEEYPKLVCVITGKGPLKEYYIQKIKEINFKNVAILTPWLESADYPMLLASADIGVSLHTSSSGLDLPMKVVDMFGCGLPVCAYDFKCLNELVRNNENGYVFKDSQELFQQLKNIFYKFPRNEEQNQVMNLMKKAVTTFQELRWTENWNKIAKPKFM